MSQKSAKDAMTPVSQIFSLDINFKLDEYVLLLEFLFLLLLDNIQLVILIILFGLHRKTMGLIASAGHSRIPIYSVNPNVIIGFILVKNLIKVRPEDETSIRDLPIRRMPKYKHILTL
jgi:metal transporter CNNM